MSGEGRSSSYFPTCVDVAAAAPITSRATLRASSTPHSHTQTDIKLASLTSEALTAIAIIDFHLKRRAARAGFTSPLRRHIITPLSATYVRASILQHGIGRFPTARRWGGLTGRRLWKNPQLTGCVAGGDDRDKYSAGPVATTLCVQTFSIIPF